MKCCKYKLRNSFIVRVVMLVILQSCCCNAVTTLTDGTVTAVLCGIEEFDCGLNSNDRQCINISLMCDGKNDCQNDADEANCVSSVHAAECDHLVLALNGDPYNETEFLISSQSKKLKRNVKIRCECDDKTQPIRWLWNSGGEILPQDDEKSREIFARVKDPPSDGTVLFIQKGTTPFNYVGAYRCTNTGINKTSIDIVVTDPTVEVIVSPVTEQVVVKNGNESLTLTCSVMGLSGGNIHWTKDGSVINNSTRHIVDSDDSGSRFKINNLTKSDEGVYHCVYDHNGAIYNSNETAVSVKGFVEVVVEPSDMFAVEVCTEAQFKCTANGYQGDMFMYQWKLNGSDITGATDKTFIIPSVNYNNSGTYECAVTNHWGDMMISEGTELNVTGGTPPIITIDPTNTSVLLHHGNENAMFSCEAEGGNNIQYAWFSDGGVMIEGETSNTLVLSSVTVEKNNTQYYCVASNKSGSTKSNSAQLIVNVFIEASVQPATVTAEVTSEVVFECVADGYQSETFKYQWILNGTEILDANNKTLMIIADESGMYGCVVTNYLNMTANSNLTQLTVTSLPKIIEHPPETIHVIVNSSTDQITLNCTVEGEGVVYWEKDGAKISDSERSIVPGGNTLVIAPDSIVATIVGMYRCIASNIVGSVMSNSTSVTVTGFIEVTVDQSHQSAEVTTEVTFTCNASGYLSDMFTYQWRLDQTNINGAISSNYIIPSVNESDQGMYDCVVTNHWSDMKVSAPVQLNITSNPPVITTHPMNTTVSLHYGNESATFSCGVNGGGSDIKYTWYTGTVDGSRMIEGATSSKLVLTPVTIGMNGTQYYCVASNNSGSSTSNVAHLTVDYAIDLPVIVSHPPETIRFIVNSSTDQISLSCTVEGEGVVYWEKDGAKINDSESPIVPGGNTLVIAPDSIITTSVGMYRCIASNIVGSVMSSSTSVTVTGFIKVTVDQSHQSAEVTTEVTFTCNASGYKSDMFTYQWRLDQTDIDGHTSSNYIIPSVNESDQGMYDCVVTNHWSEMKVSAPVQLNITRNPPVIVMGPQNLTVSITSDNSSKVEFSCMTEGRADHHWFRDGGNVSHTRTDKKHSVYHVNIILSHNGTQVYCEASNGSGVVRSDIATLTILVSPPKITENPQMLLNGTVGDVVVFHCEAESFGNEQALKYHWLKILNDSTTMLLSFANTSTLQFIATPEDDSTLYQCGVTNENGTVFSTAGRLNLLPIITRHPENVHVVHNTNVILQCEAVGGSNITYKWTKDGAVLLSDNGGSLMLESVQESDEGAYQCVAMNSRGETATSKSAILVVYDQFSLNINITEDIDYFVLEGTNVYISCDVTIEPRPSGGINITWSLQNTNVDLSSIPQLVENNGTSSLILQLTNIERENKGTYVCTVDDGNFEGGINISTNVIVEYPPSITAFAEVDPIKDGENLYLVCSASGVPTPSIAIYRNGEEVVSFLGGSVEQTITSASAKNDHGTYSCNASSTSRATEQPFPIASKSIQVIVQDVPDKIAKSNRLRYNPVSLTSVNLTWGEPFDGNSPITNYTVSCGNCPMTSIVVDSNATELVVSGLTPGVEYEFNVAAVNKFGRGQDSNTVMAQSATPESTTVKSLDAVPINEVSVVIAWTDPELYAPMIKEYTIHAVSDMHDKMITVPAGQHEVNITDLVPTFSYNVSVVVTYQPVSFMSELVVHSVRLPECRACVKPVLMQPTNKNLTDFSFTIEWSPVTTGLLQNYTLFYRSVSSVKRQAEEPLPEIIIPAGLTSYTVKNLTPYSTYCFSLQATYAQEGVVFSQKQSDEICDVNTPPIASSAPVNVIVRDAGFTSVTISWSAPIERHGIITHYKVYYSSKGVTESQLLDDVDNLEFQISNLNPGTEYTISVSAITYNPYGDDLEGPKSDIVETDTSFKAPELVARPSAVTSPDVDQLTVIITIPYIDQSKGGMSHYLVVVVIGSLPSTFTAPRDIPDNQLLPYDKAAMREYNYYVATGGSSVNDTHVLGNGKTITIDSTEYYNRHLDPDQQYSYFVRIYSKHNSSMYSTSELSQPFVIGSDDGEETSSPLPIIIGVVAAVCLLIIILLIFLAVYMMRLHAEKSSNQEVPIQDPTPSKAHIAVAAAAAAQGLERRLSVPSINSQCIEICTSVGPPTTLYIEVGGKPLPEVQWFKDDNPTVHRVLPDGSLYIEKTEVADGGKYTARATNSAGQKEESVHVTVSQPSPPEGDSGHYPIRVEDFAQHVALSRSNMEELFIKEYEDLEVNQTFTQYNAKISVNKNKNRYINIIPYDHSRVPLEMDYQTTGSDYINASFIDGYSGPGEYIATQGPVPSTFSDFWQMLWERRCNTIVMLTNLKEDDKIKCHQYWPSYGSATYGRFRVTLKSVECLAEYSIRVFTVEQLNNENDTLEVHQFHYTVWPDHGVPDFGTPLLSFHSRVEKFFKRGGAPMVVHCSAGVGRTGTFIVIDTQLQRIRHLSNIDIFNNVRMLRYNRNHMVQTQSQYTFLHDVILEAIMCGDTSLGAPVQNIVERLHELATVDQDTNETLFQKQFKMLDSDVLQERKFTYTVATAPKNAAKNRYKNHLAADQNFVCLAREDDTPGYINASFVDGYRLRNAFIVTQGPLENTVSDFWEMIWEHKSHAIVMLTPLIENEEEQCYQYWPDEGNKEYGSYVVEVLKIHEPLGSELRREFKLSHVSKPMECRVITQFHFTDWPVDSCPENGASIIELIDSVERVQRKTGNGPITVHCNNGVGRSGTFCAMVASLERFKTEQMADVFQTIKKMRMQRAGIVQTPEQYQFLHKTLLEAIERFDTYSNFT